MYELPHKLLNDLRLRKLEIRNLGNFTKTPEMLGIDGEYPASTHRANFEN